MCGPALPSATCNDDEDVDHEDEDDEEHEDEDDEEHEDADDEDDGEEQWQIGGGG